MITDFLHIIFTRVLATMVNVALVTCSLSDLARTLIFGYNTMFSQGSAKILTRRFVNIYNILAGDVATDMKEIVENLI